VRQRWSWLVLAVFHRWLLAQRQWVRPGSATFMAIDCAVKRWQKLVSFADDDDMPVSNNWVGNHIRPNAQGIANWLFIDGLRAGQLAAGSWQLAAGSWQRPSCACCIRRASTGTTPAGNSRTSFNGCRCTRQHRRTAAAPLVHRFLGGDRRQTAGINVTSPHADTPRAGIRR
jgi:hypothetical protein